MKRSIIAFASLTLTFMACSSKVKCDCNSDKVCITIVNATGKRLESVRLFTKGIIQAETASLGASDKTCLAFTSPGENAFTLTAISTDGSKVISREEYSEGGYEFIGTVTEGRIEIETDNSY
jgi:hypothetical protein